MYIILIGTNSDTLSKDEIVSCSAIIINTKDQLQLILEREAGVEGHIRVFEVSRELLAHRKVSIDLVSLEENKLIMHYSQEEGLVDDESK